MKTSVKIMSLLMVTAFLSSCMTYKQSRFKTSSAIENQLPKMEIYFDSASIRKGTVVDVVLDTVFYSLANYELNNNCFSKINSNYTIRFNMRQELYKMSMAGYTIPGALSLGTLYFIGWPVAKFRLQISLGCQILDENLNPIAVYEEMGKSKVVIAMYYGFTGGSARLEVAARAITDALKKIKSNIDRDAVMINNTIQKNTHQL